QSFFSFKEYHILFMVLTTAACYLLCWMPYGVVAMMATFGPPNIISPVASVVPSLLAKSSTVINPLIYILMNKQVRKLMDGVFVKMKQRTLDKNKSIKKKKSR
uniref:G-protein coupled receptors family 1 profile domain-containing protein n=1 Tax=Oryzias sinensis TaxID=183150 RepID=A0A8C8DXR2_9TELE